MTSSLSEVNNLDPDRLLSSVVILHEASNHEELIPDLPGHLATVLGASSVVMVLVGLGDGGSELGRVVHASPARLANDAGGEDWVGQLLQEWMAGAPLAGAEAVVTRFSPSGGARLLFVLDPEHVVAFHVEVPAESPSSTDTGRAWMLRLLRHVARNLRARINRPSPLVRSISPLNELTDSEWRVLMAIDCDDSEKEIATSLSVSAHTLHSHIKNVYRILRVRSRLSAIAMLHRAERQALLKELAPAGASRGPSLWNDGTTNGHNMPATIGETQAARKFGRLTPRRIVRKGRSEGQISGAA